MRLHAARGGGAAPLGALFERSVVPQAAYGDVVVLTWARGRSGVAAAIIVEVVDAQPKRALLERLDYRSAKKRPRPVGHLHGRPARRT